MVSPVVPELKSDVDTQYFDVLEDEKEKPDSFATPRVSCGEGGERKRGGKRKEGVCNQGEGELSKTIPGNLDRSN